MADAPILSPELSRSVSVLARTLVAAARSFALYPPDHPAVRGSLETLRGAILETCSGQAFSFSVTPDTLMVAGIAVTTRDAGSIAEAARWLHDRDILQLTFRSDVGVPALQQLLAILSEDSRLVRQRGGPGVMWSQQGDGSIVVEQIDFSRVLQDSTPANPVRRKDDLWRSIVRAVLDRRRPTDEAAQARILEISGDVIAIGELTADVIAPHRTADGSPMLTSQAAAVVAAYHHLMGIVDVLSPERRLEVMQNIAAATSTLDPRVVLQMLGGSAAGHERGTAPGDTVVSGIMEALDDTRVAQLLATTLAIEGRASQRLATVFNTIASDDDRKQRVLALTRHMLGETDFGRQQAFQSLWAAMEELLLTYDEQPFVSASYRTGLDNIGVRAEGMAAEAPADLMALIDTLGQDNVRRLSVTLLIDLLTLERDPARADEVAGDVGALAEDLLLAGDYTSALAVVTALQERAADTSAVTSGGSRAALDAVARTGAFRETAEMLGEMASSEAGIFVDICRRIGPAATYGLITLLEQEALTPARARATAIVRQYGTQAVEWLRPLTASTNWAAQRNGVDLLGETGAPEAVPLLQPMLRSADGRVTAAAVRALSHIKDPAAARAIHTVLRSATGDQRRAVVDALVAERDPRAVPVLARILQDSEPFGADHTIVLAALDALSLVGDDQAVPVLSALMRKKKFFGRAKVKAVRKKSLAALRAMKTPGARRAIEEAAKSSDRMLRKLAEAGAS
jgi:HEAT repeat protein